VVRVGLLLAALCAAAAAPVHAQESQPFPARPVRLIVPTVPGTGMDTVARTLGPRLADALGQSIVVDNRGGGSGTLAADAARFAAPNGHTLLLASVSLVIRPLLYKVSYDVARDFTPVTQLSAQPYLLMASPAVPAKSVSELVAHAKANPGKLNYGSVGNGSQIHLMSELFRIMSNTDVVHVPYKGITLAYPDLISGSIQFMFGGTITGLPHVKAQRVRALAVSGPRRARALPELPTVSESGVPGFAVTQWYSLLAPAGTPRETVALLNREFNKALQNPEVAARIAAEGSEAVGSTPQQLADHMKTERAKWAKVIQAAGIRGEE
jgi:tripartite-type tricarboxylate transporter receptor subunit TctC